MNTTLAKVYGAIIGIPLAGIMLASVVGGGSPSYDDAPPVLSAHEQRAEGQGTGLLSEADAYENLGKYNPCIFIQCDGE